MNSTGWRLAEFAARLLPQAERDSALGDIAEAGENDGAAFRDILGLVARRQAELWSDWRPWVALLGLSLPLAALLTAASRRIADSSAIYCWLYMSNWSPAFIRNAVYRGDLLRLAGGFLLTCMVMTCWSSAAGLAIGVSSRRAAPINTALFLFASLVMQVVGAERVLGIAPILAHARERGVNGPVFAVLFYRVTFPIIIQTVVVLLPFLWGLRHCVNTPAPQLRRVLLIGAVLATAGLAILQTRVLRSPTLGFPLRCFEQHRSFRF
jgi:hypothetical protein